MESGGWNLPEPANDEGPHRPADAAAEASSRARMLEEACEELAKENARLRHETNELQAIYDGMVDGLLIADIETMRLVRANPAICSMLGYSEEELLSLSVSDIHPAKDFSAVLEVFEAQAHGHSKNGEGMPVLRKDGSIFYADISTQRVHYDGRPCLMGYFRDITQQRCSEERARDTRALFDNAVNILTDIFYVFDTNGKMLVWNNAFKQVSGYSDEELAAMKPVDFFRGDDVNRIAAAIGRIWTEGTSQQEAMFVLKDGTAAPYEFTGSVLVDGEGKAIGFSGTGRDLSERRRAEESLRASEKKYRDYIDNSPVAFFAPDTTGRYVEVNRCACRFLGYSEEELTQMSIPDVLSPEEVPAAMASFNELLHGNPELNEEYCFVKKDGARFYMSVHAVRLAPDHIFTFCVNTTDRRRAEEEAIEAKKYAEAAEGQIRKGRDLLQAVIDGIDTPLTVIDPNFHVLLANRAARRLAGGRDPVAENMACYRMSHQRTHPCDDEGDICPVKTAIEQRQSVKIIHHHRTPEGVESIVEVTATPMFDEHGEISGVIESYYDVTALKKAEAEARAAERAAETADRAKSEFLANMSHEIRTPMTAILGFADILAGNPTPDEAAEAVQIIQDNGRSLLQLINDILDLSKIEAGKYEVHKVVCSPRQIAADVLSTMKIRADQKGLSLTLDIVEPISEKIRSDPVRLRQILVNLVGNAIKFTESGGVRVVMQMGVASKGEPQFRCEVVDTGIGMTAEQVALLFQPFSQVDASARRRFGGTGLGLAISKRLAEMLDGKIEVHSIPGQGSTFTLTIAAGPVQESPPQKPVESVAPEATQPSDHEILRCRILLAEDGLVNQRLVSLVLSKAGAEVTVVDNGQTAVELALAAQKTDQPFAAVLMDMQMPIMDGYEATRILRGAGFDRPIIALTAHAMTEDRQKCINAGCDDYISKPIDQALLLDMTAKYISRRISSKK